MFSFYTFLRAFFYLFVIGCAFDYIFDHFSTTNFIRTSIIALVVGIVLGFWG